MHGAPRQPIEFGRFDADREGLDAHAAIRGVERVRIDLDCPTFVLEIAREIAGIVLGLKADQIVVDHGSDQTFVVRKRCQHLGRRKWNMQKNPIRLRCPRSRNILASGIR